MSDDTQPTMITFRYDLMQQIIDALRICSEDLEAEINARYAGAQKQYPTETRRYMRDMAPVNHARELLDAYQMGLSSCDQT